jgi:large subunit ribosomal protein L31
MFFGIIFIQGVIVKEKIHPKYEPVSFTCSCGNVIETRSTIKSTHIEICNKCHPFYTGKQKLIDSAGRVERFNKRYAATAKKES